MAERNEIQNTLQSTQFGSSLKDLSDGDLSRGYFDASPGTELHTMGPVDRESTPFEDLEPVPFEPTHGRYDQYGFIRRPLYRGDVKRN